MYSSAPDGLDQALPWLLKAAEQNHADAQYLLSCLYEKKKTAIVQQKGYTTREERVSDPTYMEYATQERYWLKEAAKNGCEEAIYVLY